MPNKIFKFLSSTTPFGIFIIYLILISVGIFNNAEIGDNSSANLIGILGFVGWTSYVGWKYKDEIDDHGNPGGIYKFQQRIKLFLTLKIISSSVVFGMFMKGLNHDL